MSLLKSVDISCDVNANSACHDRTKVGAASVEDARKLAVDLGWKAVAYRDITQTDLVRMSDVCPACAKVTVGAV